MRSMKGGTMGEVEHPAEEADEAQEAQEAQEIEALEREIFELTERLNGLRANAPGHEVRNYTFATQAGDATLLDLFGEHDKLFVIHNMGQGCRYCTLWADGFNGFLPHLEAVMSVVLVSKDDPATQRRFANQRGWRFRLASHGGGEYIQQQSVSSDPGNYPGAVMYERHGDRILRRNSVSFGPGDMFCSHWNILAMAGLSASNWTPQYSYWKRPQTLDDGGQNVAE